jgi:serine/threonine protein kinase
VVSSRSISTGDQALTYVSGSTFYLSPESQGGLYERLESYSTLHNDIWSLGVILVNLTCGRNPWRQATVSDETFRAFVEYPDFLKSILPITEDTHHILKGLFAIEPTQRTSLADLRRQILGVRSFTLSDDELRYAHSAARLAAAAVRQAPPPTRPQPLNVEVETKVDPVPIVPPHPKLTIAVNADESTFGAPPSPPGERSWSGESVYEDQPDEPELETVNASNYSSVNDSSSSDLLTPSCAFPMASNTTRSTSSEEAFPPVTPPVYASDHPRSSPWRMSDCRKRDISHTEMLGVITLPRPSICHRRDRCDGP